MTAVDHHRAGLLYLSLRALPSTARTSQLEQLRAEAPELAAVVETFLASDADDQFLSVPALGFDGAAEQFRAWVEHAEVPFQVGPYRLLRRLGEGGSGLVYLAEQTTPVQRRVALKILRSAGAGSSAGLLQRFELERQTLALLSGPSITPIFDAGVTPDGRPYFAMEYVPGVAIHDYCARNRLGPEARVRLVIRVCRALEHAHRQHIVHRDVKCANILIVDTPDGPLPKIIDFGVAKLLDTSRNVRAEHVAAPPVTEQGVLLGTLGSMAPEQIAREFGPISPRTDVYALGVLLYELVAGRPPYRTAGVSLREAIQSVTDAPPAPLDRRSTRLADLESIIQRALAKRPADRYSSGADLAADLECYLDARPVRARTTSAFYRFAVHAQRNRQPALAVAAVLVLAACSILLYGRATAEAARRADDSRANVALLVEQVEDVLSRVEGTEAARRKMLDRALSLVEQTSTGGVDRSIMLDLRARVLEATGDLERATGHGDAAMQTRRLVLDLRTRLARLAPGEEKAQLDRSTALIKIGDLLREQGRRDLAEPYYAEALQVHREWFARTGSTSSTSFLAWSYERMDDLAQAAGDFTRAAEYRVRRFRLADRVYLLRPDNAVAAYGRGIAAYHMLQLATWRGEHASRAKFATEVLRYTSEAVDREPLNPLFRSAYAQAFSDIVIDSLPDSEISFARRLLAVALVRAEDWSRLPRANPDSQVELARLYGAAARLAARADDLAAARDSALHAINLFERLYRDPVTPAQGAELIRHLLRAAEWSQDSVIRSEFRARATRLALELFRKFPDDEQACFASDAVERADPDSAWLQPLILPYAPAGPAARPGASSEAARSQWRRARFVDAAMTLIRGATAETKFNAELAAGIAAADLNPDR